MLLAVGFFFLFSNDGKRTSQCGRRGRGSFGEGIEVSADGGGLFEGGIE